MATQSNMLVQEVKALEGRVPSGAHSEIAAQLGCTRQAVHRALTGKTKRPTKLTYQIVAAAKRITQEAEAPLLAGSEVASV